MNNIDSKGTDRLLVLVLASKNLSPIQLAKGYWALYRSTGQLSLGEARRYLVPPVQLAICGMGCGPADIPPVHPAVGRYRQTNWWQGYKFAKKKLSIYF